MYLRSLTALIFIALCAVLYAQQQQPLPIMQQPVVIPPQKAPPVISDEKAKMIGYVENYFMNPAFRTNDSIAFHGITMRKSLEWGEPEIDRSMTRKDEVTSITYKFLALINDKDRAVFVCKFSFVGFGHSLRCRNTFDGSRWTGKGS